MSKPRNIAALRMALAALEPTPSRSDAPPLALGAAEIDAALGGGLAPGALHEAIAARAADMPAAAGFVAGLLLRMAPGGPPCLWVREAHGAAESGELCAQGLAEMGLDPGRLILVRLARMDDVLRAAHEALRCPGLGAVVIEAWGAAPRLDLTASRRLLLAAEASGVTGLVLRVGGEAETAPSAALTRWRIAAAPSASPGLRLPGPGRLEAALLRHRAGRAGASWHLEWDHDAHCFRHASLSGAVPALSFDRPAAPALGDAAGARRRAG